MNIGDYVIHWADRPCDKMIAKITKFKKGRWHGKYVNDGFEGVKRNQRSKWRSTKECPSIEEFGRELIKLSKGFVTVGSKRPCVATYPDGKPRKWEGSTK